MAEKKFHLRHIELWIIGFVLALGAAVFFFVYGINQIGPDYKPGYYEIVGNEKAEVPHYGADYGLFYYLDGTSGEINLKLQEMQATYAEILSNEFALTDEEEEYAGYVSIAKINKSPNTEVSIPNELYTLLEDVYQKTNESENYSIFAEPLYAFWYHSFGLLDLETKINRDPLYNEISQQYLDAFSSIIKDRNEVDLLFLGNNTVKLVVSDHYKALCEEYEINTPYIGLNTLKTSYVIRNVMAELTNRGLNKGILISKDGIISQGSGVDAMSYSFYESNKDSINYVGQSNIGSNSSGANFHYFDLNQYQYPLYYEFEKDGVTYYRSLHIDISTGIPTNNYYSTQVLSKNTNPVSSCYINNELVNKNTIEEIKTYLTSHHYEEEMVLIDFHKDDKIIYVSNSLYNFVSLSDQLDYNLIKF